MASSTCSSSLLLQSTPLRGLILSKTRIPTPFLFSSPLSVTSSIKTHNSFNLVTPVVLKDATHFSSAFIRSVSVSSEFDLEEGVSSEEQNFSPDLKLFVGNLPFNVDSAELAGLFEQAGNVEMVEVIYDKLTGKSRGFGFVTMSTVDEVETAQQQFNGYELDGRTLRVNSGPPPPKDEFPSRGSRVGGSSESSNRVYVGNLSWAVDDSALETLFSEQGRVLEAKVVYDRETGRSRGFGFVTYGSAKEVDNAISSLNGVDLNGRSIRVTVAESKPRRQF